MPTITPLVATNWPANGPNSKLRKEAEKIEANFRALLQPTKTRKLVVVGTSLVQHNTAGISTGTRISNWSRGWVNWALRLSGVDLIFDNWSDLGTYPGESSRYFQGANEGVSGQTSSEIVDRLPHILARKGDVYIVDNGTNECATTNYAAIIANSQTIYQAILATGALLIILPILTRGTSSWAGTGDSNEARKTAHRVNAWRRQYARDTTGVIFFDWNEPIVDGTSTYGSPLSGYLDDDDIHFAPIGAHAVGAKLATLFQRLFPPKAPLVTAPDDVFDATHNPAGVVHPNPFYQGTSGTSGTGVTTSSGVATTMRVERTSGSAVTGVATLAARADKRGYDQVLTLTPGGSAVEVFVVRTNAANQNLPAGTPGLWVRGACDVDVSAYAGWRYVNLILEFYDVGSTLVASARDMQPYPESSSFKPFPSGGYAVRYETPPVKIPADATTYRMRVECAVDGAVAGSPVLKVGATGFRPIDDPRTLWGY